jgi:hypothetical protein
VADRYRREPFDAVGDERGEGPRDRRAPVVPDQREPLEPQRVGDALQIGEQVGDRVVLDRGRLVGIAEPAQVGRDHAAPGCDQRGHLLAPHEVGIGPAVEQHDRFAFAFDEHVQSHAVHIEVRRRQLDSRSLAR